MILSTSEENYIKTIYQLLEKEGNKVSTMALAQQFNVAASSVTEMLKRLDDKSLIKYAKYKGVTLTNAGNVIAKTLIRRHRLWELFLYQSLGFGWDEVHVVAEELEHVSSTKLIERLDNYLGNPSHDPHGDPIPDANGNIAPASYVLLSKLQINTKFEIKAVCNQSTEFLKYLSQAQLYIGKQCKLIERNDFDQSILVKQHSQDAIYLSAKVAENILVIQK